MNVYTLEEIKDDILDKVGESIKREIYEKILNIGNVVFAKRKADKISKKDLAKKTGISIKDISKMENGNENMSIASLIKVVYALDLSLNISITN